jgi:hypothetical protein
MSDIMEQLPRLTKSLIEDLKKIEAKLTQLERVATKAEPNRVDVTPFGEIAQRSVAVARDAMTLWAKLGDARVRLPTKH